MPQDTVPQERIVRTADGRRLQVRIYGPADGLPLVFHNGTPGGPVAFGPSVAAAAERGLRTIVYARPGYGASTPAPGRTVADAAADVAAVLDDLGADQFVTGGRSGGGPHALACAALLPGRCLGAVCLASAAPFRAEALDWLAGMAAENLEEFGAALAGPEELTAFLTAAAAEVGNVTGSQVARALGGLLPDVDKAVITGEYASYLAESLRTAVSSGIAGWRDDDLAFIRDWGFPLDRLAPVAIWHGDEDLMVPFAHGQWLAARVPDAKAHLIPGAGHLSLGIGEFGLILDDLLSISGL